jgi:endo-chitodextinase
MPQVGDPVPEKPSALPMATPFASGFTISAAFASLRPRTRLMLRIALGVLVVVVWLTASFNAPAAFIALSATVQPSLISGSRDVRLGYTSDINDAVMRLYVNGKRWGAGPAPNGSVVFSAVADGDYTFAVRAAGLNGAVSVWSNEVKLNLGTSLGVTPPVDAKRRDAARLLLQGSFGPRSINEIDDVTARGSAAWIDAQAALPWTPHTSYFDALRSAGEKIEEQHAFEAIWQNLIFSDARLRARVALALSEIFVISNIAPDQDNDAMVGWMDLLYRNAFGNYRILLEEVTLHPAMGYYLNMLGNDKEDPATGRMPNENYAREVLQLFSVGLVELNADGSPKKDGAGKAIPTYTQPVVQGFAAAFTGWNFAGADVTRSDSFDNAEKNWIQPMRAWPSRHSSGAKTLFPNVALQGGRTPEQDLSDALDAIANHANVAPFIGKRLIQFLVTSNPSPAYVARVSSVWNNNGSGARGDLKAVVRAILLDAEARNPDANSTTYGKVREPMVRFIHFANAMGATSKAGRNSLWWLDSPDDYLGQSPLLAPSVFNFFSPSFTRAGPIAAAGLVAPEMQMVTDTQIVGSSNFFARMIQNKNVGFKEEQRVDFNVSAYDSVAGDTNALLDRVNWMFFAGGMTTQTRDIVARAINKIDVNDKRSRVDTALVLATISPEFVIQK